MARRRTLLLLSAAAAAGCAAHSAPAETSPGAGYSAQTAPPPSAPAAQPASDDAAAAGPASSGGAALTADLPDDGRVLFDGDRSRGGLGTAAVSGSYGDNTRKWLALRSELRQPRPVRAAYSAPPAPGNGGLGLRAGGSAPAIGGGQAFDSGDYARFQQSLYATVYPVLSRLGWQAHPRRGRPEAISPYRITVHHTEGHQTHGEAETAREVRNIQEFHMGPERGWADIGYHFLIDGDGRIAEGRPTNVLGAHAEGANDGNIGISMMGNFDLQQPTSSQVDSLERLSAYLAMKYDIRVDESGRFEGHNHHDPTSCPGRNLTARLAELRARVLQQEAAVQGRGQGANGTALASFTPLVVTHPS